MKALKILADLKLQELRKKYHDVPNHAFAIPKYLDNKANGLERCILNTLHLDGWQAERIKNTGRFLDKRKAYVDVLGHKKTIGTNKYIPGTGTNRCADISAIIKGRSVKFDIKIGWDKQSQSQFKYQQSVEKAGGIYLIVKSF